MKFLFSCLLSFLVFYSFGQPQKALIKKYGIKKVTAITVEEGVPEKQTTITYYDDKGNDTSTHMYGSRYQYSKIMYDKQGRITNKETFWNDGKLFMTYVYTYSKDGSYRVDDEDAQFKMKTTAWYNAKGNVLKATVPDGSIRTYFYDAKGNIIKYQSTAAPGEKAKLKTAKHKFDKKGRVIETVWSDGGKSTYKYDERGLLTESSAEAAGNENFGAYKAKTIYQYD